MYNLLPYLWIVFMLGLVVATIVAAMLGRPKKAGKSKSSSPAGEASDPLAEVAAPSLDFDDEMAQMNK
jgi:uncharacterized membrane protein YgaE (UPF0421/DUF939 family)